MDILSDILYNTCFRSAVVPLNTNACYLPHNAILFFDKNDHVLDFIEICFDCRKISISNKIVPFKIGDFSIDNLQQYFKQLGLKISLKEF